MGQTRGLHVIAKYRTPQSCTERSTSQREDWPRHINMRDTSRLPLSNGRRFRYFFAKMHGLFQFLYDRAAEGFQGVADA